MGGTELLSLCYKPIYLKSALDTKVIQHLKSVKSKEKESPGINQTY